MRKSKMYYPVHFKPETIHAAEQAFFKLNEGKDQRVTCQIRIGKEHWSYDSLDEFYAAYNTQTEDFDVFMYMHGIYHAVISTTGKPAQIRVMVTATTRAEIDSVFSVFDAAEVSAQVEDPDLHNKTNPIIFIGHGRSKQWRDLKDHLRDHHGFEVQAYETGARAGHHIRDILDDMVTASTFALLVLTAEDEVGESMVRARQNVVHELGLFQGALGFNKAIALLEEGTEEFSNLAGIQQIRFSRGNIRETFGDVLATLRREFGDGRAVKKK